MEKDNGLDIGKTLVIFVMAFALFAIIAGTCRAQEPDLQGYSIEVWEANNEAWQVKYDSLAQANDQNCDSLITIVDSLETEVQVWYDAFEFVSDSSIKVGDHYFEIHDTISGNWTKIQTKSDEVWLSYYADSLVYSFWVVNRESENRHFEFWIGDGNGASQIMRMDTSQFRIDYKDLNKYFK